VVEQFVGELGVDSDAVTSKLTLKSIHFEQATEADMTSASIPTRGKCLAFVFLVGTDNHRYGWLVEELENDNSKGTNNYHLALTPTCKGSLHIRFE
jgi:hypothetical protein